MVQSLIRHGSAAQAAIQPNASTGNRPVRTRRRVHRVRMIDSNMAGIVMPAIPPKSKVTEGSIPMAKTQKTLFPKPKRKRHLPLKAKQRTPITPKRPKNQDFYAVDEGLPSPVKGKGSIFHHTLSNTRGRLWLSSLSLRSDVQMSWTWKTAPKRLKQLKMQYPGTPEFITVVPRAMQDSHFPPTAVEVFEVMDGFVVYE